MIILPKILCPSGLYFHVSGQHRYCINILFKSIMLLGLKGITKTFSPFLLSFWWQIIHLKNIDRYMVWGGEGSEKVYVLYTHLNVDNYGWPRVFITHIMNVFFVWPSSASAHLKNQVTRFLIMPVIYVKRVLQVFYTYIICVWNTYVRHQICNTHVAQLPVDAIWK